MEDIIAPDLTNVDTCKEQSAHLRRSSEKANCAMSTKQLDDKYPEDTNPESISGLHGSVGNVFKTTDYFNSIKEINEEYKMAIMEVMLCFHIVSPAVFGQNSVPSERTQRRPGTLVVCGRLGLISI